MWITISPIAGDIDYTTDHESAAAMEQIIGSANRGEHIVFADRVTLQKLLSANLSNVTQATIRSINTRYPELASIERTQIYKVFIDPTINKPIRKSDFNWNIPLSHFSKVALIPAVILAENLRDASAFVQCAMHANYLNGMKGLKVTLTKDSGGGADIPTKFHDLISTERQFTLAVTDTDKTYPSANPCAPTSKCADLAKNSAWVANHVQLDGFEIENILPTNLLRDSITNSAAFHDLCNEIAFIDERMSAKPDSYRWCDLKLGTKFSRTKSNNTNAEERQHWRDTIEINQLEGFQVSSTCTASEECPKSNARDCECILTPGLGSETLERFNTYCKTLSIQKQCERVRTSANGNDWLKLGEKIASWGAALEKQRS